jgi:predicted RNA-binding Zn-ribbon protein involved in translation (DUF1610 family)
MLRSEDVVCWKCQTKYTIYSELTMMPFVCPNCGEKVLQ